MLLASELTDQISRVALVVACLGSALAAGCLSRRVRSHDRPLLWLIVVWSLIFAEGMFALVVWKETPVLPLNVAAAMTVGSWAFAAARLARRRTSSE